GETDRTWLAANREQLFAEAYHLYAAGEPWWPDPALEKSLFVPEQTAHLVDDEAEDTVAEFIELVLKDPNPRVTTSQIATRLWGDQAGRWPNGTSQRVATMLRHLGWEKTRSHGQR